MLRFVSLWSTLLTLICGKKSIMTSFPEFFSYFVSFLNLYFRYCNFNTSLFCFVRSPRRKIFWRRRRRSDSSGGSTIFHGDANFSFGYISLFQNCIENFNLERNLCPLIRPTLDYNFRFCFISFTAVSLPGETPSRAGDGLLDRISGRGDTEGLMTTGTPSSASFPNKALMFSLLLSGISKVSLQGRNIISNV